MTPPRRTLFDRLADAVTHPSLSTPDERRRARLAARFALIGAAVSLVFASLYVASDQPLIALSCVSCVAAVALALVVLARTGRLNATGTSSPRAAPR